MSYKKNAVIFDITYSSYSKCKDILQMLNVYKIPAKEHAVVDRRDPDEISVA